MCHYIAACYNLPQTIICSQLPYSPLTFLRQDRKTLFCSFPIRNATRHHFLVTRFEERIAAFQTLLSQRIEVWNKAHYRHFSHPFSECRPLDVIPHPLPLQIGLMLCIGHRDQCFPLTTQIQNQFGGRLQNDLADNIAIFRGFGFRF